MKDEMPPSPWIHIGECPSCVNGLCRVRTCDGGRGGRHFYALCDECEAMWREPNTDSPQTFPDAEQPSCPICSEALYGPQAHWTQADEIARTDWANNAIFDLPSDLQGGES